MENSRNTLLIVDDTETNIDILVELLGKKYDVIVALDGESALEAVQENRVNLILLDIMMPVMNGYELCRRLKERESTRDIPVIFISAKDDEESILSAYEEGAIDYITKPFKPLELLARITTQLRVKELIEHLDYISSYDQMSGVYNRRKFFELSQKKFLQSQNNLYAVMIDIDNFKSINDTHGHPDGDKVIEFVAQTIYKNLGHDSIFGRLGGEEFAILCTDSSKQDFMDSMQMIREVIEKLEVISGRGESIKFTISLGVAKVATETQSLDELLKKADRALYEAKDLGRNKVVFAR
jgi:two-component system glycerol uptake and utilization response regulator